jgi:hypothetical protein
LWPTRVDKEPRLSNFIVRNFSPFDIKLKIRFSKSFFSFLFITNIKEFLSTDSLGLPLTEAPELFNDPFLAELSGDLLKLLITEGEVDFGKVYQIEIPLLTFLIYQTKTQYSNYQNWVDQNRVWPLKICVEGPQSLDWVIKHSNLITFFLQPGDYLKVKLSSKCTLKSPKNCLLRMDNSILGFESKIPNHEAEKPLTVS